MVKNNQVLKSESEFVSESRSSQRPKRARPVLVQKRSAQPDYWQAKSRKEALQEAIARTGS